MNLILEQVRCNTLAPIMGTAIFQCNAHLFDMDAQGGIVVIKCWRCKSYHTFNFNSTVKLMAGGRALV